MTDEPPNGKESVLDILAGFAFDEGHQTVLRGDGACWSVSSGSSTSYRCTYNNTSEEVHQKGQG